jgi:hypothetical protein
MMKNLLCIAILVGATLLQAQEKTVAETAKQPSVLIINGANFEPDYHGDFNCFRQLNQHGFQIDVHFLNKEPLRPITWDLIKQYNCLVILDLPPDEADNENWGPFTWGKVPPYKKEMQALLNAYLEQGGGIFLMPNVYARGFRGLKKIENYLEPWGTRLPYETVQDPPTSVIHPRNMITFVYTQSCCDHQDDVEEVHGCAGVCVPR